MNKVKLLLGAGSVAFALLATGCGNKDCSEYTTEADCNESEDKDNKKCKWNPTGGTDKKGVCEVAEAGGGQGPQPQAGLTVNGEAATQEAITALEKEAASKKILGKICMAAPMEDVSKACDMPKDATEKAALVKAINDAKDDDGRDAACSTNLHSACVYEAAGKCELSPGALMVASTAVAGAEVDFGTTHMVNASRAKIEGADGMLTAYAEDAKTTLAAAIKTNDPCGANVTESTCRGALIKFGNDSGAATLIIADGESIDKVPGFCRWIPGRDTEAGCKLDVAKLKTADCNSANGKMNPEDECGKLQGCVYAEPNKAALVDVAPAATEGAENNS